MEGVIIKKVIKFEDGRGWLAEIWRSDEIDYQPVMSYVSVTRPGAVRGPHEHQEQSDCFIFLGPGNFELHLWDNRPGSKTSRQYEKMEVGEKNPVFVLVPPGIVHGYKNISGQDAFCINLPNKLYKGKGKKREVDEVRWEGKEDSPYKIL